MPISYNTFSADIVGYWRAMEIQMNGKATLKLSTHSGRRGAVKQARLLLEQRKVLSENLTNEVVDQHFRWLPQEGRMRKLYTGHLDAELRLLVTRYL